MPGPAGPHPGEQRAGGAGGDAVLLRHYLRQLERNPVRVILDGREQEVRKLTSIGDRLYSTEETYIGRDRLEGSGT